MADMNEQELIRRLEEIANYDLPAETTEQHLQDVRGRLLSQTAIRPRHRRIRWAGLAAAAIIVVGAMATWKLFPSPRLQAAELLTQVAQNMEKLAWLKRVTERYGPDQNQPVSEDIHWSDMANKRVYAVYSKKYVHFMDYQRKEWWVYRPDTNDMILQPLHGEWTPTVQEYVAKVKREGISVRQSETMHQGRRMTVLEFDETLNDVGAGTTMTNMWMNGRSVKTIRNRFIIDPNRIMGSAELSYLERDGRVISILKMHLEPATKGPADIYELGVPKNVKIINKLPDPATHALRQEINERRTRFLNDYIAVITEAKVNGESEEIRQAKVVFRRAQSIRVDVYYRDPRSRDRLMSQYQAELEASSQCLRPFWPDEDSRDIRSIRLYDGLWQYVTELKDDRLVALEKQRRPEGDLYADDDVDDFAWRTLWWLNQPEHMYEDSYAKERGLTATELTARAGEDGATMPKRLALYVDPQRDFVCDRYIEEELFDAPWQMDKAWLQKVERRDSLEERVRDIRVSEYGRTSGGQWYPRVITEAGHTRRFDEAKPRETRRVIRIHVVAEHPRFPDDVFDPDKLPQVKP